MSVIRRPGVLGRTTQRRLVGATAALSAATVETVAVVSWFVLVVESRTVSTAMAGLGILFCGSLLRTGVFGMATRSIGDLLRPQRLVTAMVLTGSWIVWLLVAEWVGGVGGVVAAALTLAVVLTGQFTLERYVFRFEHRYDGDSLLTSVANPATLVPGALIALGATTLLATAWFTDWSFTTALFSVREMSLFLRIQAYQLGALAFWLVSLFAQQHRLRRILEP
ncbi:hypothetical protein ACFOZ7_03885 [Natribaculum luteum]|uniref:Uncharacterized protein n=1 Tax=Natribaculum luteum TaxID=1586232 RepID=A0ABD5NWH6_9EURY|nr:hypothetical protein [Natribaculum luteum]